MYRKNKLLKKVLMWARELDSIDGTTQEPEFEDYSPEEVLYHIILCIDAGFLKARQGSNHRRWTVE